MLVLESTTQEECPSYKGLQHFYLQRTWSTQICGMQVVPIQLELHGVHLNSDIMDEGTLNEDKLHAS